ncbi:MAG: NAD(P)H-dependent oxidoreductase [Spirosomataceae bacterium]
MSVVSDLSWRYAAKKLNGTAVPAETVQYILDAIQLSPSSSGLQPYEVLVITNAELKQKIQPIAYGQTQIVDASHVLVFAAWDNYTEERVNEFFERANAERGLPSSATDAYRTNLWAGLQANSAEANFQHAAKQAYIALGIAMLAAAEQKVDATPMEGFKPNELDELLGLAAKGLRSAAILTLGYRDEANDWLVNLKKVRTPAERLFTKID